MVERTTAVVAGGGPAGMVLGLLLARAGVAVLEKHGDFLRDFRGETSPTSPPPVTDTSTPTAATTSSSATTTR